MSTSRSMLAALASLLLLTSAPDRAHATCGAEGCPCVRRGLADNAGRFGFDTRFLDVTQDRLWSGGGTTSLEALLPTTGVHHHIPLYTRTRSWSFEGRLRATDRLNLSVNVPYVDREHRRYDHHAVGYDPRLVQSWRFRGLGDAVVQGQFRAGQPFAGLDLALQAGVKLPTGKRHVTPTTGLYGTEPPPAVRPGTGSTDLLVGFTLTRPLPWQPALPVSANLLRRWNGRGTDDYRVGDELQLNLSTGYVVKPWLTLTALANYSNHAGDSWTPPTASDPYREPSHSGGQALFLTPGANVSLANGVTLYGVWQNRVWGHTESPMSVARHYFLIGTSLTLGD
jgi:hypothetical protein